MAELAEAVRLQEAGVQQPTHRWTHPGPGELLHRRLDSLWTSEGLGRHRCSGPRREAIMNQWHCDGTGDVYKEYGDGKVAGGELREQGHGLKGHGRSSRRRRSPARGPRSASRTCTGCRRRWRPWGRPSASSRSWRSDRNATGTSSSTTCEARLAEAASRALGPEAEAKCAREGWRARLRVCGRARPQRECGEWGGVGVLSPLADRRSWPIAMAAWAKDRWGNPGSTAEDRT